VAIYRPLVNIAGVLGELPSGSFVHNTPQSYLNAGALPTLTASDAGTRAWCLTAFPNSQPGEVIWTGTRWVRALDGYPPGQVLYRSGTGVSLAINELAITTTGLAANTLRAFPWEVRSPLRLSNVSSEVTTLAAATSYRLGIYADTGLLYPDSLIANSDASVYDSSVIGVKTAALASNINLSPGIYWLVVNASGAPVVRATPVGGITPLLGFNPAQGANSQRTCFTLAQTFGALPATFPAGATILNNIAAPLAIWTVV